LRAAEAGALVVCNVTAGNSAGVMDALLSMVPSTERDLCRTMLAAYLKAIVVQRLLPGASDGTPVSAWEVLFNTQKVATLIRSGEFFKLSSIIAASGSEGMLLMDDCLAELVKAGYIARDVAERYVSNVALLG